MNVKKITRRSTTAVLLIGGILGAGVALAAWTQTGTGSGAAKAATAVTSVVTAGATTADLYPGKTNGTLSMVITNPNSYAVTFTSAVAGTITADAGHAGCVTTGVSLSTSVVSLVVPAGSAGTALTAPIVAMSNSSDNGCQGATFTIPLTLTGASS